jgi:diaminopimelate decarboxylase
VKANPNQAILEHFVAQGCGLEVASAGELSRALKAGCPPEKILFAGPGKTEAELQFAVSHHVGEIHVESLREAERLEAICCRLETRARIAVRVNPSADVQGGAMRMGGKPAPFGIDEEKLDDVLEYLLAKRQFEFRGIHLFIGTEILDYATLLSQYRRGLVIARHVTMRTQRPLNTVDFGGGLGIPYFDSDGELDMESFSRALGEMMLEVRSDSRFAGTKFMIEPGRFLVGEAGVYIARVNDIKISRGKKFLILDGGMNHHLAASGNLGQVIRRNFPVTIINKLNNREHEIVDVVGPLCTPLDTVARNLDAPEASVGDLIAIFQSGAYGLTASPVNFLSHKIPAEVWISDGKPTLV